MDKILVILGPTSTGKTDIALDLAKKFNGELISCDSRQIYIGLDIGTGKLPGKEVDYKKYPGSWEIDGMKIWMTDMVDPKIQYTVADYVKDAEIVLKDILARDKLPIIVGGTGLYLKGLLEGLSNLAIPVDEKLRGELQKLTKEELQKQLQSLSPIFWEKLNESDKQNPRRLLRSIELASMNPFVETTSKYKILDTKYQILKIGLTAPRDELKKRIFLRLLRRIDEGLIEEGQKLLKEGLSLKRMEELGLEYGMLAKLFEGEVDKKQFTDQLSTKIGQYAKRQMTWFRKVKDVEWFNITESGFEQQVENKVKIWYHATND